MILNLFLVDLTGSACVGHTQVKVEPGENVEVQWDTGMDKKCTIGFVPQGGDVADVYKLCIRPVRVDIDDCDFRFSYFESYTSTKYEKKVNVESNITDTETVLEFIEFIYWYYKLYNFSGMMKQVLLLVVIVYSITLCLSIFQIFQD